MPREWKDRDLKTPEHDKIMLALMDKETWKRIICKIFDIPKVYILEIEPEYPITAGRYDDQIIGFLDFRVVYWYQSHDYQNLYCEIKITEPSFGSVLRQIKRYQSYMYYSAKNTDCWLVISPYKDWENPLQSQKILWLSTNDIAPKTRKDFKPDEE